MPFLRPCPEMTSTPRNSLGRSRCPPGRSRPAFLVVSQVGTRRETSHAAFRLAHRRRRSYFVVFLVVVFLVVAAFFFGDGLVVVFFAAFLAGFLVAMTSGSSLLGAKRNATLAPLAPNGSKALWREGRAFPPGEPTMFTVGVSWHRSAAPGALAPGTRSR